ncbi:hypothetical protein SAMN02990966_06834 [Rhodospirillales bacterium URHD0017]|nr:hypothetical protein SAMN02990966_06834 [Rhodospirillales bacterium URHD0017]
MNKGSCWARCLESDRLERQASFALELKHGALPGSYLGGLSGMLLRGVLPYGEELRRTPGLPAHQSTNDGRWIMSQKIASTAAKAGKPKTNHRRKRRR